MALDSDIGKVVVFQGGAGLNLNQTPAFISLTFENINAHQHVISRESAFEDSGNLRIVD